MTVTAITDHVERAHALMCGWNYDKVRLRKLCEVLAHEVQLLEDVGNQVLTNGLLGAATGLILDEYGELLGEPRGALADAEYRRLLSVVLAAHQSDGTAVEIIYLSSLLIGVAVHYTQYQPAAYRLEYEIGTALSGDWQVAVKRILEIMRPAGVGLEVVEGTTDDDGAFQFDDGPGFDEGRLARRVI